MNDAASANSMGQLKWSWLTGTFLPVHTPAASTCHSWEAVGISLGGWLEGAMQHKLLTYCLEYPPCVLLPDAWWQNMLNLELAATYNNLMPAERWHAAVLVAASMQLPFLKGLLVNTCW